MPVVSITWEHTENEKAVDPFCVDGAVRRELSHVNEIAILFGRAASAYLEQDVEVHVFPENSQLYFSSKEVGPQEKGKPKVIN